MPICINPQCATYNQNHSPNDGEIKCQVCHTELLLKNRYWVTKLLSDNTGFGIIYLADHFGQPKIIKVLQPHHNNNTKVVDLFQKEAQILTSIKQQHPDLGIPAIDEYFTLPLGTQSIGNSELHCIVMEYVGDQDLSKIPKITDQKLALDYLKQIVNILHFIHQSSYFHRDIKPSNIMIFSSGINQGKLCLIDFGTAREMTATYLGKIGGNQGITKISSGGYSPPEQQQGQAVPQSDFYALGRTFVFLLTKIEPSDPQMYDPMNNSLNWRGHTENMGAYFLDLIDYLICEKAGERPKNTQEILDRLSIIEKNITPVNPPPVNPQTQANVPYSQQTPQPTVIYSQQTPQPTVTYSQQNQPIVNPPEKNKKSLILGLFLLICGFGSYQYLSHINHNPNNNPVVNVPKELNAKDYYNQGNAKYDLKDYQGAIADFNQAIKLDPNFASAYFNRGLAKYELKDYEGEIADYNMAIKLDSNYANAYNNRGVAHKNLGNKTQAISDFQKAAELYKEQGNEIWYQKAINQVKRLQK